MIQIGLCLQSKRHAEMIVTGNKTVVIDAERFYRYVRIPVYLFSDYRDRKLRCYGKIVLSGPKAVTLAEFRGLRSEHRITEDEREKRWPDNLNLYVYKVKILETYIPPKRIEPPPGTRAQTWLRSWKWLDSPPLVVKKSLLKDDAQPRLQPRLVPFIIVDSYISHTGSAVYGHREPHDCDLVIRDEENPKVSQALLRVVGLPSDKVHRVYNRRGPVCDYVPLLDLIAVPVDWKGPWPKRVTRHEGIPERSWDLYRAFPPAALIEDPYITLDGTSVFVREAERNPGIEIKLRHLLGEVGEVGEVGKGSQTFNWVGSKKTMKGEPLFRSYLVPHIPLVKVEINEPLFRRYYNKPDTQG